MDSQTRMDPETAPLIDISGIVTILWRRKILILTCFVGAISLAVAYLTVAKPVYTANAVILIDPRETNATSTPNVLGGIGTDSAAIASQVSVIGSIDSLQTVFNELDLSSDPEFTAPGLLAGLMGATSNPQAAFDNFRDKLTVEREGLTYVIDIAFTSNDAEKSARIANAIAQQYITGQLAEKSGASSEVTNQLNQSISNLRQQVAEAEATVQNFRTENNLFDTGTGRTLIEQQVAQLNVQLATARQAARDATNRYEQARAVGASAAGLDRLTQFLNSGSAEQLRNIYNQRISDLANAQAALGPQHPTRIRLSAEVENLAEQMRDEAARIITELNAASELATANIQRVEDDITQLQTQSTFTNEKTIELRQLERNAEASRQVLEQFLARSEQTSQLDHLQRPDARLVSNAEPPLRASWPRRTLVLAGAGMAGLMLGSLIALISETQAKTSRTELPVPQPSTDPQRTPEKSTKPKHRVRQPRRVLAKELGTITSRYVSPNHYLPSKDYLDAIHTEVTEYPEGAFALKIQDLFDALTRNLPDTGPAIIHLCGFADRIEANRLAFAVGQEARLARWEPLIIDMDPLKAPDRPNRRAGSSPMHIDQETGIKTISPASTNAPHNDADLVEELAYDNGDLCDIIIVIGKPISDPATLGAYFAGADENVLVLSKAEEPRLVDRALAKSQPAQSSQPFMVTIDHGDIPVRPTLVHRDGEVGRAIADLGHLVRKRAS